MKLKLAGFFFLALFALVTVVYVINRPSSTTVTYPFPNGYDAVCEAGETMSPLPLDFDSTQDVDALGAYVSDNADQVAQLEQAVDYEYLVRISDMTSMEELLERSALIRNASRLLYSKARLAELGGDSVEAADALAAIAILGRRSSRGGLLIHQQMAVAVERQGLEGLMQLADKLSPDEKSAIHQRLRPDGLVEEPIEKVLKGLQLRERDMTKREYGTLYGSFLLWQTSDIELFEQHFETTLTHLSEVRKLREELMTSLESSPSE